MITYQANRVSLDADIDYGEGYIEFQWSDTVFGWECLTIDLNGHCSRRMPIHSGQGLPTFAELQQNRMRLHFDANLAKKLQLEEDVEILFDVSEPDFQKLRQVVDYLIGERDSRERAGQV
jgi:hypothetical protein